MEEAFLAEQGFTEKLIHDIDMAAGNTNYEESVFRWVQGATGPNRDHDYHLPNQVSCCRKYCLVHFLSCFFGYIFISAVEQLYFLLIYCFLIYTELGAV